MSVSLIRVELPGRVERSEAAVDALGGLAGIGRSLENGVVTPLSLKWSPGDRFGGQTDAFSCQSNELLIRMRKRRNKKSGVSRIVGFEVVGVVERTFRFRALADFFYSQDDKNSRISSFIEDDAAAARSNPGVGQMKRLPFYKPPYFAKIPHPIVYNWHEPLPFEYCDPADTRQRNDNAGKRTGNALHQQSVSTSTNAVATGGILIRFEDSQVPQHTAPRSADDDTVGSIVRALFELRPLWFRPQLNDAINEKLRAPEYPTAAAFSVIQVKRSIASSSYAWKDGPWRGTLCRLGFDPRCDFFARKYQVIDFRDPALRSEEEDFFRTRNSSLTIGGDTTVNQVDFNFVEAPSKQSQLYMLCDICDSLVQDLIANSSGGGETGAVCTAETGWFSKASIEEIRNRLTVKAQRLRRKAVAVNNKSSKC